MAVAGHTVYTVFEDSYQNFQYSYLVKQISTNQTDVILALLARTILS